MTNQKSGVGKPLPLSILPKHWHLKTIKCLSWIQIPQGNAIQGLGVKLESVQASFAELAKKSGIGRRTL